MLPLPQADLTLDSIKTRLQYLCDVGLGYLSLDRTSRSLSGGETQRINLTTCLGAGLTDTLFALDEPTIGLHHQDVGKLVEILRDLARNGNIVCVVEHDEQVIRAADRVIELDQDLDLGVVKLSSLEQLLNFRKQKIRRQQNG